MPPLILAIDTAFSRCMAAVFDAVGDGRLLSATEPEIGKGHAERLVGVIDDTLSDAGASYRDLGRIVVTTGPGSFTGIRVGVAAARGLSLALDSPAIGVSTLAALAHGVLASEKALGSEEGDEIRSPVLAILDARRGEVYAALHSANGDELNGPAALAPELLHDFVAPAMGQAFKDVPLRLVGSGAAIAAAHLAGHRCVVASESDRIDPEVLARLGAAIRPGDPPRPLYLRGADAKPSSMRSLREQGGESIP
ncbi:tRNA (adenosine(37)-N6)-threonylcarbamoyltransferase complex dimerization subunit type 1 TsaB [Jiella mangrovi]|uniref:tRNA (Adenosine(37)-N6)-threonylcarbamoyltransferase complex dimerization subunit type 1 TsaB n=1 Tax=Jiella mangrovi TaxID=2821407 RepID=A0ABS4BHR2_9HYPH|nr:tRNA (adenosine(37)-N6)-threonylcarbamoyltransferase complex dimerization subunit type 1 TsaB [Jiella mangrovi]MBP0616293.1 tRNA (adenosine(37)-N6)-threonylcarbamoyltransferase complex dimerization subunit type 1 TsaB [Jiella mangrovi]